MVDILRGICLLYAHLISNLLHSVLHHLGQVQDENNCLKVYTFLFLKGNYLQCVLGVHKAALQFLPFAWVGSVAVDQGDQVGEPPELGHLQDGQNHAVYHGHLQVDVVKPSHKDP